VPGHGDHAAEHSSDGTKLWALRAGLFVVGAVAGWILARLINRALGTFFRGFNWAFEQGTGLYGRTVTLFLLNRHLDQPMPVDIDIQGFGALEQTQATELRHDDLAATNTKEAPDRVKPAPLAGVRVDGTRLLATLAPASWNVIRLAASE